MRKALACLVAAALLGCNTGALKGMGYSIGAEYWEPALDATMEPDGGGGVDEGKLGMDSTADVYAFSISVLSGKRGMNKQAERWTIGFWQAQYGGAKTPTEDLQFGDTTFDANEKVTTEADFMAYRFAYEERTATPQGESSSGWLGLAFFTFDVGSKQPATGKSYSFDKESIPALTVGYRYEVTRGKVIYYASVDWMDLSLFKLKSVTGQHFDWSAGIKFNVTQNRNASLTAGYRNFDGDYSYDGNTAHFVFSGFTFGGEFRF